MRTLLIASLLWLTLAVSHAKAEVPLHAGGKLSAIERKSIIAIHPIFTLWTPDYSTLCVWHGNIRHICLRGCGIGSLSEPYIVFVFDHDGKVIEANLIEAPNPSTPKAVFSLSPLRVAYERSDKKSVVIEVEYPPEIGRHELQKQMDRVQKLSAIFEAWRRSGSTDIKTLDKMMSHASEDGQK